MKQWFRSVRFFQSMQLLAQERTAIMDSYPEDDPLHWTWPGTTDNCALPIETRHPIETDGYCPCWAKDHATEGVVKAA